MSPTTSVVVERNVKRDEGTRSEIMLTYNVFFRAYYPAHHSTKLQHCSRSTLLSSVTFCQGAITPAPLNSGRKWCVTYTASPCQLQEHCDEWTDGGTIVLAKKTAKEPTVPQLSGKQIALLVSVVEVNPGRVIKKKVGGVCGVLVCKDGLGVRGIFIRWCVSFRGYDI